MDLQLTGKVVMVAAASTGLGFGIAQQLAREGAVVSMASRTSADIGKAAQQLRQETPAEVFATTFDATDPVSITDWTAQTLRQYDRIDGLVTNAGGPPVGNFDDFDDRAWESAFQLTLMSVVRLIRSVLPSMREHNGGSILTLTSTSIKVPIDNLLLSNVMRSGVASLAKSLSRQLGPEGIRVNNLVPGRIATARVEALDAAAAKQVGITPVEQRHRMESAIPVRRYGTINEFGAAAAFLLSPVSSYITGATLTVDGGMLQTI